MSVIMSSLDEACELMRLSRHACVYNSLLSGHVYTFLVDATR